MEAVSSDCAAFAARYHPLLHWMLHCSLLRRIESSDPSLKSPEIKGHHSSSDASNWIRSCAESCGGAVVEHVHHEHEPCWLQAWGCGAEDGDGGCDAETALTSLDFGRDELSVNKGSHMQCCCYWWDDAAAGAGAGG